MIAARPQLAASLNDPLRNVDNAARWIAALPAGDVLAIQKEALELVAGFPGARNEIAPAQVEALLRIDARLEPVIAQLTRAVHDELPEEHGGRVAAVARGVRPRQGVHRGLPARAEGGLSARRQQALARDAAVGAGAARALQGPRRQVPAVPLQPLDSRAVARVPRALRVRADARLAARAARVRRRRVRAAGRLRRAGVPEDAAADAPRLGQLHARPGRVGGAAARGLGADADAGAAAGQRRRFLRRPDRPQGLRRRDKPSAGGRDAVPRRRPGLRAHRRAHALAARAGRRRGASPASCRRASSGCC